MNHMLATAALAAAILIPSQAFAEGNLASNGTNLPDLTVSAAENSYSQTEYDLETGKYYRLNIICDETADDTIWMAPEFFRNVWINQIVINDLEVKPLGVYSLECDSAGTFNISFVPLRPGEYDFYNPGNEERGMKGKFVVK
jgi:hypothetical protein